MQLKKKQVYFINNLKGTVQRDFLHRIFFMNGLLPSPLLAV
jgi:hypothetical protein